MEAVTLTAEQILHNQKAYKQTETTLFFEIQWADIELDLNDFLLLATNDGDIICEVFESEAKNMIVTIECFDREVAEHCYEKLSDWFMDENIFVSKLLIF